MHQTKLMSTVLVAALGSLAFDYTGASESVGRFEKLPEETIAPDDVSGVSAFGDFLLIGADESTEAGANVVQVLTRDEMGRLKLHNNIELFVGMETDDGGTEMDIEGLAVEGDTVIVIGSHSAKRPTLKKKKKYEKNRLKLNHEKIKPEPNRAWIYRLTLDKTAAVKSSSSISLAKVLREHPVLGLYHPLPSKENGIDIEGVALASGKIYLGFRGPVLRGNYVPVMVLAFDELDIIGELRYLLLGGRGIRSMARTDDGFLIIAGPVGDGAASYQLYHWDGNDMIPGKKRGENELGTTKLLGTITPPSGGKAEGMTVIAESDSSFHLLIAYDGVADRELVLQHLLFPKISE